jgi:hypothetical protein
MFRCTITFPKLEVATQQPKRKDVNEYSKNSRKISNTCSHRLFDTPPDPSDVTLVEIKKSYGHTHPPSPWCNACKNGLVTPFQTELILHVRFSNDFSFRTAFFLTSLLVCVHFKSVFSWVDSFTKSRIFSRPTLLRFWYDEIFLLAHASRLRVNPVFSV